MACTVYEQFFFFFGGFENIVETILKTISYKKFFYNFCQFPIHFLWG